MNNIENKKPIVVSLFGPPGAGKSTLAAFIFAKLKMEGVNCELVTEFAKDKTWEKNSIALANQVYVLAQQYYRMDRCSKQVDVIITDSPIFLSPYYNKDLEIHNTLQQLAHQLSNKFDNLNYFVKRVKKYNPIGRNQTEKESDKIAVDLKEVLKSFNTEYTEIEGTLESADIIITNVLNTLNAKNSLTTA